MATQPLQPKDYRKSYKTTQRIGAVVPGMGSKTATTERGGILWDPSTSYKTGDIVGNNDGVYLALKDSVNIVPLGHPTEWLQIIAGAPTFVYNYQSDLLGTASGGTPAGPHTFAGDGLTDVPDENGPYFFSIAKPSAGKSVSVTIDGFQLGPTEYNTNIDGYVEIEFEVYDNSTVKIIA